MPHPIRAHLNGRFLVTGKFHFKAALLAFNVVFALDSHLVAYADDCRAQQRDNHTIDPTIACEEPGIDAAPDLSFDVPDAKPAIRAAPLPAEIDSDKASPAAPLPFAFDANDASISAKASLSSLKDYHSKLTAKKIGGAKAVNGSLNVTPYNVTPNVVTPGDATTQPAPLDIWSALQVLQPDASGATRLTTSTGIDYNISGNAKVGVAAERVETSGPGARHSGSEDKISAYAAFKALPELTVDTKAQWTPAVQNGRAAAAGKGTVTVAPRIGHTFEVDKGHTIQPFVTLSREFDFAESGAADGSSAAGAGVTVAKPGSYSLSVTTDVSNGNSADPAALKSGFELKLPIE